MESPFKISLKHLGFFDESTESCNTKDDKRRRHIILEMRDSLEI
jgi:hypothetical protein